MIGGIDLTMVVARNEPGSYIATLRGTVSRAPAVKGIRALEATYHI